MHAIQNALDSYRTLSGSGVYLYDDPDYSAGEAGRSAGNNGDASLNAIPVAVSDHGSYLFEGLPKGRCALLLTLAVNRML